MKYGVYIIMTMEMLTNKTMVIRPNSFSYSLTKITRACKCTIALIKMTSFLQMQLTVALYT